MFCAKCGNPIPDGAAFCPACGTAAVIGNSGLRTPASNQGMNPVNQGWEYAEEGFFPGQSKSGQSGNKRSLIIGIVAVVAVCVFVLVAICGIIFLSKVKRDAISRDAKAQMEAETQTESPDESAEDAGTQGGDTNTADGNTNTGDIIADAGAGNAEPAAGVGGAQEAAPQAETPDADQSAQAAPKSSEPVLAGFSIYADTVEDYEKCLDPKQYIRYDTGIPDFSFYYPADLYNSVKLIDEPETGLLGYMQGHGTVYDFGGSGASELQYEIFYYDRQELQAVADFVHTTLLSFMRDPQDILFSMKEGYANVVVAGGGEGSVSTYVYTFVRVTQTCLMRYSIIVPAYTSETDRMQKNYVTECLYRMCGFSDAKDAPRSYTAFLAENDTAAVSSGGGGTYTDEEICRLCLEDYIKRNGSGPSISEVASRDGDELLIHLYDDMEDHTVTWDWYTINRITGKGTNFNYESVSLW